MKTSFTNNNKYSEETAHKYIKTDVPLHCTSSFIEIQYEYIDNKRTDKITGYKL